MKIVNGRAVFTALSGEVISAAPREIVDITDMRKYVWAWASTGGTCLAPSADPPPAGTKGPVVRVHMRDGTTHVVPGSACELLEQLAGVGAQQRAPQRTKRKLHAPGWRP